MPPNEIEGAEDGRLCGEVTICVFPTVKTASVFQLNLTRNVPATVFTLSRSSYVLVGAKLPARFELRSLRVRQLLHYFIVVVIVARLR